ncbi:hypothetical protein [Jannaschia seohaensis]|uniref:Arginine transporter n=1 Tax=Jannaschia seohaensis TaxID=475081 RepID=A0A2Y9C8S8_9RHOB|nr:hypothetical protein [Jannaschia seohaensis]PWJ14419.1 hypothetical protein BCF38_11242 [Jannaschia seohaensis]SSA50143.1 hypothetical protein SAMN05421539_11242 [Jannaschia seohaensis]
MKTPIKLSAAVAACLVLSACGGGRDAGQPTVTRAYATGPVQTACLRADRRAASTTLCGCVQAAADSVLSRRDQSRAVQFFKDPHQAQVTRQSDRRSDEAFWQRYKTFVAQAERLCA